jgi:predicted metal-dependent peptidase
MSISTTIRFKSQQLKAKTKAKARGSKSRKAPSRKTLQSEKTKTASTPRKPPNKAMPQPTRPQIKRRYTQRDFDQDLAMLYLQDSFFGLASLRCAKRLVAGIPTAAMMFDPEHVQYLMIVNPMYFGTLNRKERLGAMIHELYHLLLQHVALRRPENIHPAIWNHAVDLATNSLIVEQFGEDHIAAEWLLPGRVPYDKFPKLQSAEFYLKLIQQDEKLQEAIIAMAEGVECDGDCENCPAHPLNGGRPAEPSEAGYRCKHQFDDHSKWMPKDANGNDDESVRELAKAKAKEVLESTVEKANNSNQWGNIPAEIRKIFYELLKPKVNWKAVLKRFVSHARSTNSQATIKRRNRRYGMTHPGTKRDRFSRILVAVDQSGSVSDAMLLKFFGELMGMAKSSVVSVIHFDYTVDESSLTKYRKGQAIKPLRTRGGGTCFDSPVKWANQRAEQYDGLIILTDLEAPYPQRSLMRRMWCTMEGCKPWDPGSSEDDDKSMAGGWGNETIVRIPEIECG